MRFNTNLVSDSPLVQETVDVLRFCGGEASCADIADIVLKLPDLEPDTAALLVAELVKDDQRLHITNDFVVQLRCSDDEARLLAESPFVVVDVETTGAKTPPNRITEVGAYRIERGRIVAEFQSLVNPQTRIPPFIVGLTGITDDMVKQAPLFSEIAASWLDFAGDAILVAHNAQFDVRFLNYELSRIFPGQRMVNSSLCTVKLSRSSIPGLMNYRLHTIAEHFHIPILNRHRAAGDALATAEIFLRILDRMHLHGVRDIAEARQFKFGASVANTEKGTSSNGPVSVF
jgi:DNA polymerase III epsilon subunit family exonuclease